VDSRGRSQRRRAAPPRRRWRWLASPARGYDPAPIAVADPSARGHVPPLGQGCSSRMPQQRQCTLVDGPGSYRPPPLRAADTSSPPTAPRLRTRREEPCKTGGARPDRVGTTDSGMARGTPRARAQVVTPDELGSGARTSSRMISPSRDAAPPRLQWHARRPADRLRGGPGPFTSLAAGCSGGRALAPQAPSRCCLRSPRPALSPGKSSSAPSAPVLLGQRPTSPGSSGARRASRPTSPRAASCPDARPARDSPASPRRS
jgi:hypothetical protein